MSKKILVFGGFFLSFFCPNYLLLAAEENNQQVQPVQNQYPQELIDGYMNGCVQGASQKNEQGEGLSEEVANSLCTCTINKFQAKYSTEEFLQMVQDAQVNGNTQAADRLNETAFSCATEILGDG